MNLVFTIYDEELLINFLWGCSGKRNLNPGREPPMFSERGSPNQERCSQPELAPDFMQGLIYLMREFASRQDYQSSAFSLRYRLDHWDTEGESFPSPSLGYADKIFSIKRYRYCFGLDWGWRIEFMAS